MHKFDVQSIDKLDNEERRKRLSPDELLHKFGLAGNDIVADIGCGIGYFTLPAAIIAGPGGKVYALDILDEMLVQVRAKAHHSGAKNIETLKIQENQFLLPDQSVTFALVFFVLHEAQEPQVFFAELHRILQPGGKVALIDWEKREMPQGPPLGHRIAGEEARLYLEKAGFSVEAVPVGDAYYGYLGVKG